MFSEMKKGQLVKLNLEGVDFMRFFVRDGGPKKLERLVVGDVGLVGNEQPGEGFYVYWCKINSKCLMVDNEVELC